MTWHFASRRRFEDLVRWFQGADSMDGIEPWMVQNLSLALRAPGRFDEAARLRLALAGDPKSALAMIESAHANCQDGNEVVISTLALMITRLDNEKIANDGAAARKDLRVSASDLLSLPGLVARDPVVSRAFRRALRRIIALDPSLRTRRWRRLVLLRLFLAR
jgi:hypothetical protein